MKGYEPETYGERIAARYDDLYAELDPTDAVEAIARLAGGRGPVLELAIGTGRIALPLAERHVEVHGVDVSRRWWPGFEARPAARRSRSRWGTSPTCRSRVATQSSSSPSTR